MEGQTGQIEHETVAGIEHEQILAALYGLTGGVLVELAGIADGQCPVDLGLGNIKHIFHLETEKACTVCRYRLILAGYSVLICRFRSAAQDLLSLARQKQRAADENAVRRGCMVERKLERVLGAAAVVDLSAFLLCE